MGHENAVTIHSEYPRSHHVYMMCGDTATLAPHTTHHTHSEQSEVTKIHACTEYLTIIQLTNERPTDWQLLNG